MARVQTVLMVLLIPLLTASHCQMTAAMNRVRDVHSGVVAAFRATDQMVAPLFEVAGDRCITRARDAGLEGAAAREHARECMSTWYTVEEVLSGTREALAELENIYQDIEGGTDRYADWQAIATRLLEHGRQVSRLLVAVGVTVPDDLIGALDTICQMVDCED